MSIFRNVVGKPRLNLETLFLLVCVGLGSAYGNAQESPSDGTVREAATGVQLWDARTSDWVAPEAFWLSYAPTAAGKFWGRSETYPAYSSVNEHDTLLIELEQGTCLMYFFHERWRRAQDVRRWDPAMNELEGCPYVFDN